MAAHIDVASKQHSEMEFQTFAKYRYTIYILCYVDPGQIPYFRREIHK